MNVQAKQHLDKAVDYVTEAEGLAERSDDRYHKACDEINAAKEADSKVTKVDIARHLNKSTSWLDNLINWDKDGRPGNSPKWSRGSHGTRKEAEAAVEKFFEEASDDDIVKRLRKTQHSNIVKKLNPVSVASAIANNSKLASAISDNSKAQEKIAEAGYKKLAGGSGVGYVPPKSKVKLSLVTRMGFFSNDAHSIAEKIALTWRDDAPICEDPEELEVARDVIARAIIDFEETITAALRETSTIEGVRK